MRNHSTRSTGRPSAALAAAAGRIRELLPDWTRDADGELVDWTQAPYYVNGILDVHLPGEDKFLRPDVISKRVEEYTLITRKKMYDAQKKRRAEEIARRPYRHRGPELSGRVRR